MNRRVLGPIALAAVAALGGATAFAQDSQPAAPTNASDQPAAPPAGSGAPAASAAPADSSAAPAASAKPGAAMGYSYNAHSKAAGASTSTSAPVHHSRMARHAGEALATFTGFEMLADGGSRLFVQLSRPVDVEQTKDVPVAARPARKGKRAHAKEAASAQATNRLVFTLKGAEVGRYNDENSLETMHFNTPVVRARLVPSGKDLKLVVVLRQDVTPTLKSVPAKDNGSIVQIDFPQGTYLPAGDSLVNPATEPKQPVQGALPSNDSASSSGDSNGPQH